MYSYPERVSIKDNKLEMIAIAFILTLLAIIFSILTFILQIISHTYVIGVYIGAVYSILFLLAIVFLSISSIMSLAGICSSGYRVRSFFIFIVSSPILIAELFIFSRTLS